MSQAAGMGGSSGFVLPTPLQSEGTDMSQALMSWDRLMPIWQGEPELLSKLLLRDRLLPMRFSERVSS